MNYANDITFNGSDLTLADTEIQFSTGTFLPNVLDEAAIGERTSFPGLTAADIGFLTNYGDPWVGAGFSISGNWVDWNRNGSYQLGLVAANITDGSNSCTGTALDVLNDHDDVTFLSDNLATTLSADAADTFFGHPEEISCTLH
jgi:hypothetical protein